MWIKRGLRWAIKGDASLVGSALLVGFVSQPHASLLMERATRMATLGPADYTNTLWVSPHQIVLIPPHSEKGMGVDTATRKQRPINTSSKEMGELEAHAPQSTRWQQDLSLAQYLYDPSLKLTLLSPVQRHQVEGMRSHLPKPIALEGFATSPDGKQAAYLLQVFRGKPRNGSQPDLLLPQKTQPENGFALYRSGPNGENMQEVAREPMSEQALQSLAAASRSTNTATWPHALQFTPDGKHVSFLYKRALWKVPLE